MSTCRTPPDRSSSFQRKSTDWPGSDADHAVHTKPDTTRLRDGLRLLPDLIRCCAAWPPTPTCRAETGPPRAAAGLPARRSTSCPTSSPYSATPTTPSSSRSRCARSPAAPAYRPLERHWPGTPDGLATIRRLAGLSGNRPPVTSTVRRSSKIRARESGHRQRRLDQLLIDRCAVNSLYSQSFGSCHGSGTIARRDAEPSAADMDTFVGRLLRARHHGGTATSLITCETTDLLDESMGAEPAGLAP
jgi:hypothetical protein